MLLQATVKSYTKRGNQRPVPQETQSQGQGQGQALGVASGKRGGTAALTKSGGSGTVDKIERSPSRGAVVGWGHSGSQSMSQSLHAASSASSAAVTRAGSASSRVTHGAPLGGGPGAHGRVGSATSTHISAADDESLTGGGGGGMGRNSYGSTASGTGLTPRLGLRGEGLSPRAAAVLQQQQRAAAAAAAAAAHGVVLGTGNGMESTASSASLVHYRGMLAAVDAGASAGTGSMGSLESGGLALAGALPAGGGGSAGGEAEGFVSASGRRYPPGHVFDVL